MAATAVAGSPPPSNAESSGESGTFSARFYTNEEGKTFLVKYDHDSGKYTVQTLDNEGNLTDPVTFTTEADVLNFVNGGPAPGAVQTPAEFVDGILAEDPVTPVTREYTTEDGTTFSVTYYPTSEGGSFVVTELDPNGKPVGDPVPFDTKDEVVIFFGGEPAPADGPAPAFATVDELLGYLSAQPEANNPYGYYTDEEGKLFLVVYDPEVGYNVLELDSNGQLIGEKVPFDTRDEVVIFFGEEPAPAPAPAPTGAPPPAAETPPPELGDVRDRAEREDAPTYVGAGDKVLNYAWEPSYTAQDGKVYDIFYVYDEKTGEGTYGVRDPSNPSVVVAYGTADDINAFFATLPVADPVEPVVPPYEAPGTATGGADAFLAELVGTTTPENTESGDPTSQHDTEPEARYTTPDGKEVDVYYDPGLGFIVYEVGPNGEKTDHVVFEGYTPAVVADYLESLP